MFSETSLRPKKRALSRLLLIPFPTLRKDLKYYLNKATQSFEILILNRGKSAGVVAISLEEYNALQATQHELSSAKNEQRLDAVIAKFKQGQSLSMSLPELGNSTL